MKANTKNNIRKIAECAILVALAFCLQLVKIEFPFGGAITIGCMVPVILASYRNGIKWGLGTAFVFSVIKLLLGLSNFTYVTGIPSFLAVFFLDYVLAFTLVGVAGIVKVGENDSKQIMALKMGIGALLGVVLRLACHVVSGAVVWYDLTRVWEEGNAEHLVFKYGKWAYSLIYNGLYMVPETVITVCIVVVLALALGRRLLGKKKA